MTGTVRKLVNKPGKGGGFGFIRDQNDDDRFFHANDLRDGLVFEHMEVGQLVTFEPKETKDGLRAEKVKSLEVGSL